MVGKYFSLLTDLDTSNDIADEVFQPMNKETIPTLPF
jgi:hypothetical protein